MDRAERPLAIMRALPVRGWRGVEKVSLTSEVETFILRELPIAQSKREIDREENLIRKPPRLVRAHAADLVPRGAVPDPGRRQSFPTTSRRWAASRRSSTPRPARRLAPAKP